MRAVCEIPPHSLEAERAVLGAILLETESLPKAIEVLKVSDFYKDAHRRIFAAMLVLHDRGIPVDLVTLRDELRRRAELEEVGGEPTLAVLLEEGATARHARAYAEMVREYAVERELVGLGESLVEQNSNGTGSSELLDRVERKIGELKKRRVAVDWPLFDAADEWAFPEIAELIESLLPASGIVWWGGLPKRYKSLFALYVSLTIACRRSTVAKRFLVRAFPKILYVAREDGGSRLKDRRADILSAWKERPEPGAIKFVIRPRLDLMNPAHISWLRETCLREGVGMLVLDTWTALSPSADPLGAKDQAQLAATIMQLCEDMGGLVIVVDHSRKNRPEGQPLSSAEIFGPPQKWAAAEHVVMLDLTADGRRLEVFVEGKDLETRRFLLTVSPRGSGQEKFSYAGTSDELADAQRAIGDQNREAVSFILQAADVPVSTSEVVTRLQADGITLARDTVQGHIKALVGDRKAQQTGKGRTTKYFALNLSPEAPSAGIPGAENE